MAKRGKFRTKFKKGGKPFYAIRNPDGTFDDIQSLSRAVPRNIRQSAERKVKPGQGFRGDTVKKGRKG